MLCDFRYQLNAFPVNKYLKTFSLIPHETKIKFSKLVPQKQLSRKV